MNDMFRVWLANSSDDKNIKTALKTQTQETHIKRYNSVYYRIIKNKFKYSNRRCSTSCLWVCCWVETADGIWTKILFEGCSSCRDFELKHGSTSGGSLVECRPNLAPWITFSFPLAFREAVNSSWSANQGDSASSSDETSSANGDSLFSMFSGPDLVAAVKQRRWVPSLRWVYFSDVCPATPVLHTFLVPVLRKHSCGEPEVCTLPSPPLHHISDDNQVQDDSFMGSLKWI